SRGQRRPRSSSRRRRLGLVHPHPERRLTPVRRRHRSRPYLALPTLSPTRSPRTVPDGCDSKLQLTELSYQIKAGNEDALGSFPRLYENANSFARCTAFTTALIKVTRS